MIIVLDAAVIESLVSSGRYWFVRPNGTCYATTELAPVDEGDQYLLDASEEWLAQWGGDYAAIEEFFKPMLDQINGEA
jgi:uncharacterized protein YigE (DUF2233 family)